MNCHENSRRSPKLSVSRFSPYVFILVELAANTQPDGDLWFLLAGMTEISAPVSMRNSVLVLMSFIYNRRETEFREVLVITFCSLSFLMGLIARWSAFGGFISKFAMIPVCCEWISISWLTSSIVTISCRRTIESTWTWWAKISVVLQ